MRRIADLHPGTAKTDARGTYVIAAARTLPHTLRRVGAGDEALAELEVLIGCNDDLAGEATRISNRIHGPPLERVLGPKIAHPAALELLPRCGGTAGCASPNDALSRDRRAEGAAVGRPACRGGPGRAGRADRHRPGTIAAGTIRPRRADSLRQILQQRDQVADEVERMLDAHPPPRV